MEFYKANKVVIIIEQVIAGDVIDMITKLGVSAYAIEEVAGMGRSGTRSALDFTGLFTNTRIEAITTEELAKKVAVAMVEKFFIHYTGIVYIQDVETIRI